MWLRTTNEVEVSGVDNEHDDQERTNWGGETIKEDWEGAKSRPDQGGGAYQAWYAEKQKANNQKWVKRF
jgi:hypothetical protein